ncbi:hypothetical protein JAAARDRAFT_210484 [Jaapia argillacea MUCL 33604]|uniref:Ubiquitin-like domain-containing protein n=1 Tax=Jaapia argillacea MUCL 33604 TaxID=933084 RepID=A0A067PFC5_9AGAM|nr:hypothetical protein JAAARDRAFT_210484 [Jaapia argillacea MUCL 33604]
MSEEAEDIKPKLGLVINFEGQQTQVKVKTNTQFTKIFEAVEKKLGKAPGTLRFAYDGERVQKHETPGERGMEDGDVIDAMLEQLGGSSSSCC